MFAFYNLIAMQIKIDSRDIEVSEGETIIEAAQNNGIFIPALCYAVGYKHQASCMVCVVKICKTGEIVPACTTIVTEGMYIENETVEIVSLRRQSLELLLSEHVAVCCSPCNPKKCKFWQYTISFHAKRKTIQSFSKSSDKFPQHVKNNLWFDVTKCIKCGLCVYNSNNGFSFQNRGFEMEVVLPKENVLHIDEALWDICPTQSLYRDFLN